MIRSVSGEIVGSDLEGGWLDLAVEGLGMVIRVAASRRLIEKIGSAQNANFFTHLQTSDSGPELFGFADAAELAVFELLITVPRIGPRLGQRIVSELSPRRIAAAINAGDSKTLQRVSGVGGRAASRIIADLEGKLSELELAGDDRVGSGADEALAALESLGYPRGVATDALSRSVKPGMTVEEQISAALGALV